MNSTTPQPAPADDRYVYVDRPRCPDCESVNLRVYKSQDQGDDSILRYTICRNCGARFKVVAE